MDLFDEQVTGDAHLHELAGQLGRLAGVRAANVLIMEPTVVVTGSSGAHMALRAASPVAQRVRSWGPEDGPLWTLALPRHDAEWTELAGRWQIDLPTESVHRAVKAWAPCTRDTDALSRLGSALDRLHVGATEAQHLFSRHKTSGYGALLSASYPDRPDGRFTASGCVEPYPGAWPDDAIFAAFPHRPGVKPDFTALWPYMTG